MIFQSARMALESVWESKMRSFLTMLGIIIGVFALVVLVSLMQGGTDYVAGEISSLGGSYYTVSLEDSCKGSLTLEDLTELMEQNIGLAAPLGQARAEGKYGRNSGTATVYGTTAAYADVADLEVAYGTFLRDVSVENASNVAVLDQSAAEELMGTLDCLGQTVMLSGVPFRVIGVLGEDNGMSSYFQMGYSVYIPYTSARRLNSTVPAEIRSFYLGAAPGRTAEETLEETEAWLQAQLNCTQEDYTVQDNTAIEETMRSVTSVLQLLVGAIAAISLVVGGIGIMNIMLVSVTERTREIGIRKAIGASPRTILLQFLIEAMMLSLLGCLLGLALSALVLWIVCAATGINTFTVNPSTAGIAVAFSTLIGLLFGLQPASRAASKPPIDALRYGG